MQKLVPQGWPPKRQIQNSFLNAILSSCVVLRRVGVGVGMENYMVCTVLLLLCASCVVDWAAV